MEFNKFISYLQHKITSSIISYYISSYHARQRPKATRIPPILNKRAQYHIIPLARAQYPIYINFLKVQYWGNPIIYTRRVCKMAMNITVSALRELRVYTVFVAAITDFVLEWYLPILHINQLRLLFGCAKIHTISQF